MKKISPEEYWNWDKFEGPSEEAKTVPISAVRETYSEIEAKSFDINHSDYHEGFNDAISIALRIIESKVNKATKEDFIQYVKDEYGIDVSCVKSDNPDTFDKLFGQKG